MKKVLIITYYWPPMGGGGVQRWLKFSKYLRDYGWEPIIYTPENADVSNEDPNLTKEIPDNLQVIKRPIWEPFDLYKKFMGKSKEEKIQPGFLQESDSSALVQKISVWIRGNLFIPDAKMFWIKPSIRFLTKYLKKNTVDAIVSTGPPHTNHLIALGVKKKLGVKWIADFRDPWTNIDYYDKLQLTSWANQRHHKLEQEVFKNADEVVTVSWSWAKDFERITKRMPVVITNGYDEDDFQFETKNRKPKKELVVTHIGSLNKDRNPHSFWKALKKLTLELEGLDNKIHIQLIGPTDISVFEEIDKYSLNSMVKHIQNLPHNEVIKQLIFSDVLLLPLNNTPNIDGVIPGKLYEYMAARKPILCIGKIDGDSARIIKESTSGQTFDFNDVEGIYNHLSELLDSNESGRYEYKGLTPEKYSRKVLAGKFCDVLNQATTAPQ